MELTLARFVHALRSAEIPVSPAETLDALEVVRQVGVDDGALLRNALSLTLAKTAEEKARFDASFERFFGQLAFEQPAKRSLLRGLDGSGVVSALGAELAPAARELIEGVLDQRRTELAWRLEQAARGLDLDAMRALRDKSRYVARLGAALGIDELDALIARRRESGADQGDPDLDAALRYLRQYALEQVRGYVDRQYALRVDATGKRAVLDAALSGHLDQLPPDYYREVGRVVQKLADRLARNHRRRRRRAQRGHLDLKRTLRRNVAYDGNLFELHWRAQRRRRSTVFVVCDLSSSVGRVARFLLMFLHDLADVLPALRTFGFSNRLGEITGLFARHGAERAVEEALFTWGKGTTDYGQALVDLRALGGRDLDRHATVIFLGDARGNYYPHRADLFRSLAERVRRVYWLNPEPPERWSDGDSLMHHYAPYCQRVDRCARLADIERFADRLLEL
jgi:uncharacterized protein